MSMGGRRGTAWWRPGRAVLTCLFAVTLLLAGCATSSGHGQRPVAAGTPGTTVYAAGDRRPVPDITASTLDGSSLSLRDLTGSGVVVINVWASWCTSCRAESAAIAAVADEMREHPVQFLGVDELDSASSARRFLAAAGTTYPQLSDPDGDVLHALSLLPQSGIPSTLLLDPQGRMAARVIGPVTRNGLRNLIASLQGAA